MESTPSFPGLVRLQGRYLGADNIRFCSMAAVVAVHCTRIFTLSAQENSRVAHLVAAPFKFATIAFFLVSGFLLERNLSSCDVRPLLLKRLRKVVLPWLFWSLLFILAIALSDAIRHRTPFLPHASLTAALLDEGMLCLDGTALWFVPNLLIGLGTLLVFRRHLRSLWLGGALLAVNLFYIVDIYTQWMPPQHTRALFAFVFYLWLGHYAAAHPEALNRMLGAVSSPSLLIAAGVTVSLSFAESRVLVHLHAVDPLNTLRLSNQLFSLTAVLWLAKLRRPLWPAFVDVPRHTFGIYLSHALIVGVVLTSVRRLFERPLLAPYLANIPLRIVLWLAATAIAWTAGFLLSRQIAKTPILCCLQGLRKPDSQTLSNTRDPGMDRGGRLPIRTPRQPVYTLDACSNETRHPAIGLR